MQPHPIDGEPRHTRGPYPLCPAYPNHPPIPLCHPWISLSFSPPRSSGRTQPKGPELVLPYLPPPSPRLFNLYLSTIYSTAISSAVAVYLIITRVYTWWNGSWGDYALKLRLTHLQIVFPQRLLLWFLGTLVSLNPLQTQEKRCTIKWVCTYMWQDLRKRSTLRKPSFPVRAEIHSCTCT